MTESGGELVARFLSEKQVPVLFTLCGGHISPILAAAKAQGIRVVDVRHEATAAFAADAAARIGGRPSVAVVTAGPGLTNTVTALQNSRMAQSPVLLIGGAAATVLRGRGSLQDIDQAALMQPIVKKVYGLRRNCDLLPVLEAAFNLTLDGVPGPVFVECPIDLLYAPELVRSWYGSSADGRRDRPRGLKKQLEQRYLDHHVNRMLACETKTEPIAPHAPPAVPVASTAQIQKAAAGLARSRRPLMIIGSQSLLSPDKTAALAGAVAHLGVPVYLAGMARGLMGADHPLLMRHQRRQALASADFIILAGMPADFRLGYGRSLNRRAVVMGVNRSRRDLQLNRKPDIGIRADPADTLIRMAATVEPDFRQWAAWMGELRSRDGEREAEIRRMARQPADPLNPLQLLLAIDDVMPDHSIVVADGGDFVATASYILRPRAPLSWLDPGVFGTLGVGAGFSLGAHLMRPKAEIWLIYGDGAAGYSLAEMDTFVRHNVPVIAVIGNDGAWAQIARDQVAVLDDDVGTVLRRSDYHTAAIGFGAEGLLLNRPEQIRPQLDRARELAAGGRPVLINALIGATDFRKGSISM